MQFIGNLITFALLSDDQQVRGGYSFIFLEFSFILYFNSRFMVLVTHAPTWLETKNEELLLVKYLLGKGKNVN